MENKQLFEQEEANSITNDSELLSYVEETNHTLVCSELSKCESTDDESKFSIKESTADSQPESIICVPIENYGNIALKEERLVAEIEGHNEAGSHSNEENINKHSRDNESKEETQMKETLADASSSLNQPNQSIDLKSKLIFKQSTFNREIYMYSIVFPALNQFSIQKLNNPLEDIVKPYHFHDGNLILDNIEDENFQIWSRIETLDLKHMIILLRSLAKFHGLVMVFREQRPAEFELLSSKLYNVMPEHFSSNGILKTIIANYDRVVNILGDLGRSELVEKYKVVGNSIEDIVMSDDVRKSVIAIHADCWVDNIVFGYQAGDRCSPKKMFFQNFQLSMMDSPIRDLSYIIYNYCNRDILEEFDFLLHVYHLALSTTVAILDGDPDQLLSLEILKQEWRRYGLFGALMSLLEIEDDVAHANDEIGEEDSVIDYRIIENFTHFGENFL